MLETRYILRDFILLDKIDASYSFKGGCQLRLIHYKVHLYDDGFHLKVQKFYQDCQKFLSFNKKESFDESKSDQQLNKFLEWDSKRSVNDKVFALERLKYYIGIMLQTFKIDFQIYVNNHFEKQVKEKLE